MDLEEKENPAIFKKDKQKSKQNDKLDAKGMDTLFRTISRNHYNLLRMVDNKASIVLTVNSILISIDIDILLSGVYGFCPNRDDAPYVLWKKIQIQFL